MGLGVLVSGAGTNLQAILKAAASDSYPARVVAVAANRSACPALQRARRAGVPSRAFPVSAFAGDRRLRDLEMGTWLVREGASILALAGYDRVLSEELLELFPGRALNLHNSLLPAFSGTMDAVRQALAQGVKVTGCTVHLVDPERVDAGPIVLQAAVPVEDEDTEATLLARIHRQEWRIFPEAIALLAQGRLRVEGRRVRVLELEP